MAGKQARFTPAARRDLDSIWDYTARIWSVSQAEAYLRGLFDVVDMVCQYPEMTREHIEFRPPVRLYRFRSHLVIYRVEDETILVVRIVHCRQNWQILLQD